MTKPERIEDLGRIAEMLDMVSEDVVFLWNCGNRSKDSEDWFMELTDEQKRDKIHDIAYGLERIRECVMQAWQLARYGSGDE